MTALEEILHAEKEAETAVVSAKEAKLKAWSAAKVDRETALKNQAQELEQKANIELAKHKEVLTKKANEMQKQTATEVTLIDTKFSDAKSALVTLVKKNI